MKLLGRIRAWLNPPPPPDPRIAMDAALDYADALLEQGLRLPQRPDENKYLAPFHTLNPWAQIKEWEEWHERLRECARRVTEPQEAGK